MRSPTAAERPEPEAIAVPLEFELERSGVRARRAIVATLLFVTSALLLLGVSPFNNVVVATGAIAPKGEPVAAHHDAGGAVAELYVARGDPVAAGQPIMRLRGEALSSEVRELSAEINRLDLAIERLRALLEGRTPAFDAVDAAADATATAQSRYEADRQALRTQLAAIDAQRETRLAAAAGHARQADLLGAAAASLAERRDQLQILADRNATPRSELLEASTRLAEMEADHAAALNAAAEAERAAEELARNRDSAEAEQRARWLAELTDALSQRAAAEEQLERRRLALDQRTIVAPVSGEVLQLGGGGPGAVIEPGGLVAEIVPSGRTLIAEIRIPPEKIGDVALGDDARIFIATYDDVDVGDVRGVVSLISPGVIVDAEGVSFYRAEVTLPETLIEGTTLRPGMSLSANILGAERTVLGYLLRPFEKGLDAAFREN